MLIKIVKTGDISKRPVDESNRSNDESDHTKKKLIGTISFNLTRRMLVRTLKNKFKETIGVNIRIYTTINTKRYADDNTPLSILRDIKSSLGKISIDTSKTVGEIEKQFKEEMGIGIQIMSDNGNTFANDNITLDDITTKK